MSSHKVFLGYLIHLNDPDRVAALQASPPGATITKPTGDPATTITGISRSPNAAAIEFANEPNGDGTPLPFLNTYGTPPPVAGKPYIYCPYFTAPSPVWTTDYPLDVATFKRKTGGWFGIPWLFGSTTTFYWMGLFEYDAPLTTDGKPTGSAATACAQRRWIDPFPGNIGGTQANTTVVEQEYSMTRDASPQVDGVGLGMRGMTGIRQHALADYATDSGLPQTLSWERLYVRWRKSGVAQTFWSAWGSAAASNRAEIQISPTGQLAVYNVDAAGSYFLLGSTGALVLNKWYLLDIVVRFATSAVFGDGMVQVFLNHELQLSAGVANPVGIGQVQNHSRSQIGTPSATGYTGEIDIGFWMNAALPYTQPGGAGTIKLPILTGADFKVGSRAVLVRPTGDDVSRANWTGDWRTLAALLPRTLNTGDRLFSTTALARLAVTTDFARSINAVPGSLGCVGMVVTTHGYRGTNNGKLGYKLNGGADVLQVLGAPDRTTGEGTAINARSWGSMMYRPNAGVTPTPITDLVLIREKGNDAVESGTDHLTAVAELIGTFNDEDYDPALDPTLRSPLPRLGIHNAPYPRSPWATSATPPLSPVVIKSGTYVGTGTFVDLAFRSPIQWLWIQKSTNVGTLATAVRWFSSLLGAGAGGKKSPEPWLVPSIEENPNFVPPAPGTGLDDFDLHTAVIESSAADIADWPITETITRIQEDPVGGFNITPTPALPATWKWPFAGEGSSDNVQYTVWAFVKVGGVWHGAAFIQMWEGRSMTDGSLPAIFTANGYKNWWGDVRHLWGTMSDYVPVAGDQIGFLLQAGNGRLRGDVTSVKERSNVMLVTLPADDTGDLAGSAGVQATECVVRIAGANVEVNAAGETYQYIAVADPGMRFMLNGALAHHDVHLPATDSLVHATFLPIGAFFVESRPGVDTNLTMGYKGPGHAASESSKLDAAGSTAANSLTFAAGALTTDVNMNGAGTDTALAFSLWRRDDGSGDPGIVRVVQMTSYVGNGVHPRNINLTPASSRRPLFALVVPHGANPWFRHPGHTGGNSSAQNGVHLTTAIIAGGIDMITVQSSLNANGTVYDVFVIPGGTTAGNDGWSQDGEFIPVEPAIPADGPWGANPEDPVAAPGAGGGGVGDGVDDPPEAPGDFTGACLVPSLRVVNIALSRVGEGKAVVAITELSKEATLARLLYDDAVETTLRDFPWPFATRYATLVQVATPANRDWLYSYRQPADCIFERRIVMAREGAVDPAPPPMALSSDATGRLIYTNEAAAILEYTRRPGCAAGMGDPLFRDALAWRLAADLAPSLTRIPEVIKHCSDQYQAAIQRAIEVIRPGNPGHRTAVDPLAEDTGVGALAANVAVVNRALIRIGAQTIANLATEQSREAEAARLIFEAELRSTLRDYPWAWATKYATGLTVVAGTPTVPLNNDWIYAYRYPADAVFVRRIVTTTGRAFTPEPPQFRRGTDATGGLLLTNEATPTIEYTARIPNAILQADDLFRDALAWRLAASLAPSLAQVDSAAIEQAGRGPQDRPRERKATEAQLRARAADAAWRMYQGVLAKAKVADANEVQQAPQGDAEWHRGRN